MIFGKKRVQGTGTVTVTLTLTRVEGVVELRFRGMYPTDRRSGLGIRGMDGWI